VVPPTRARALVSVHDLTPLRFPELANDDTRQYPALLRRALARGSEVQTGSAFIAAEIVELLGAAPDRVHVVPYGVTVGAGDPAKGRAQAGGPYVLALGTVEPRKDLPSLVKAFDAVAAVEPELRLVVAGPDGWGVEAYAAAVAAAHHRDRIVRLGWVADDARADLLAGAAVFAYPSRYEGFGLPPLEAMAAGVPVVTTAAGSLPEVVGDAAVLVEPGDVGALATGLTLALTDEATRAGLVERGRARAAGFSWDRCGAEMAVLYRSLIAS
jgi:glycosyltransferase involved in cell wall biosynthesis